MESTTSVNKLLLLGPLLYHIYHICTTVVKIKIPAGDEQQQETSAFSAAARQTTPTYSSSVNLETKYIHYYDQSLHDGD